MKAIRNFWHSTFKLYTESFLQENGQRDLTTKFVRGAAPIVVCFAGYMHFRDEIPDNDPALLEYYDLQIDQERTPNYSEQKLKEWQNFSPRKERNKKEVQLQKENKIQQNL